MNLHQLEIFCTTVERGSFALASRQLYISQPALSIQVKRLERGLGVELLRRSRTGVVPTPAGQELYKVARDILERLRTTEQRLQAIRAGEAGSLSIGVSHTGTLYLLTAILKEFGRVYPEIKVGMVVEAAPRIFEHILGGDLDAGLEWTPTIPPTLRSHVLLKDNFCIVASTDHPRATAGRIEREEFLQSPYITLPFGVGAPFFLDIWLLEHDLVPRSITYLPSIDAVKRMVEANLGLTIMSRLSVERELKAGYLTLLDMDGFQMERSIVVLVRPGPLAPLLSTFVSFAREFAKEYGQRSMARSIPNTLA
jgi:LysR family transcriptional regulator, transcriptional activator of the cysJI operon